MTPTQTRLRSNGAKPQEILRSLLGDFWYWREEHIPSSVLVQLLEDFEITAASARTAMRRLASRGLLTVERTGRTTAYGIPPRSVAVIVERAYRMFAFGATPPPWDGMWTVVVFSVPERERGLRSELRSRLRLLRFAALYDGVWVTPHDVADDASATLEELRITTAAVLRSSEMGVPSPARGTLGQAFDLRLQAKEYRRFADRFEPMVAQVEAGRIGPADALRMRTEVGAQWRRFQETDPDLPAELLPADWERDRARQAFLRIYERLGPVAELRFRQVMARVDPDLAALATRHDQESVTALYGSLADRAHGDTPFERATDARRLRDLAAPDSDKSD